MFTVCEGCLEGENQDCPLYICQTWDGFIVICCIVFAIEMGMSILSRVALDFGGGDGNEMPNM